MEARGALIYARLVVKHSYRAGNHFEGCEFWDIVGGNNSGDIEIHVHFECGCQRLHDREEYEHIHAEYKRERERRKHEERQRKRERRQLEHELKHERRQLKHERRQRKREQRDNEKLNRKLRHLERSVVTLSAIVLGTA
jgi:hypothetical protein